MNGMRRYSIAFLFLCALSQGLWVGGQIHALGTPGCGSATAKAFNAPDRTCLCGTHGFSSRVSQPSLNSVDAAKVCQICQGQQAPVDVPLASFAHFELIPDTFAPPTFTAQETIESIDTLYAGRAPPTIA